MNNKIIYVHEPLTALIGDKLYLLTQNTYYFDETQNYKKGTPVIYKDNYYILEQDVKAGETPETNPEKFGIQDSTETPEENVTNVDIEKVYKKIDENDAQYVKTVNGVKPVDGNITLSSDGATIPDTVVQYQAFGEGRHTIQLKNYDSISGIDTKGTGYNLAMISKWDKADFGSSNIEMNLNSKNGIVTINDDKQVATVDQVPDVSKFATRDELMQVDGRIVALNSITGHQTTEIESLKENAKLQNTELEKHANDVDELKNTSVKFKTFQETRKTIQLNNYDSISGVDTKGTGHNLVMLSKWDKADFGAPGVTMNLNTLDNVTINDSKVVATTDDLANHYTKEESDAKLNDYYTKTDADATFVKTQKLDEYYNKTEIDSAFKQEVNVGDLVFGVARNCFTFDNKNNGTKIEINKVGTRYPVVVNEIYRVDEVPNLVLKNEDGKLTVQPGNSGANIQGKFELACALTTLTKFAVTDEEQPKVSITGLWRRIA